MMYRLMEQLIGNVEVFVQHCAAADMIYGSSEYMTHIVEAPPSSGRCPCFDAKRFKNRSAMRRELIGTAMFSGLN